MSSVKTLVRIDPRLQASSRDLRRTGLDPNFWYPVARSSQLKRGSTRAVHFAGDPIVLVRSQEGSAFALENRCAHRQVPLHLGVVKGERLLCGYHCWAYDRSGQCVNVPYLDETHTLPNGVRAYPTREAYGFVFIFAGDPGRADQVRFPEVPTHADPHYRTRVLDRSVACHYSFMHENLMDMNHQFLHRSLMGSIRATLLDIREGEDWLEVDYTFGRTGGKQPIGEALILNRRELPVGKKDLMTIRTQYPYQTLKFWTAGSDAPALDLWNVYIPLDREQRSNHTFGLMMIRKPGLPGLVHFLWPFIVRFTEGIFGQDRRIVEAEQRAFDAQGKDLNQEVFPAIQRLKTLLARRGVNI
jgi:phenylpropionate dioxygenase-like ring-hydroxylating dioxygenase large terminal subunit